MGASQSTVNSDTNILQKATNDFISSSLSECKGGMSNNQTLTISGLNVGDGCEVNIANISQKAKLDMKLKCVADNADNAKLQADFQAKLEEQLKSSAEAGLGLSNSTIDSRKKIASIVANKVDMKKVSQCLADMNNKQDLTISGISTGSCIKRSGGITVKDIQQEAILKLAADCIFKQTSDLDSETKSAMETKTVAESVSKGADISLIGGIFGGIIGFIVIVFFVRWLKKSVFK